jgi:hypothetical protein
MSDSTVTCNSDSGLLRDFRAAHFLARSRWTLRYWRLHGYGPAYLRVGNTVFYRRADLEEFLERVRVLPAVPAGRTARDGRRGELIA